ncbi:translation initiation/elongation factor MRX8 [Aspergillus brunneoviolaceus CBS 621.78]|uniref:Uncharacterized protein n=1 Tax=Aspergillus brunneoviolaceus CBS 621.78 TaxID=1450534 RepID=A0ACD1GD44_9EURO|nr:hypothetical protein BO95DRAFT_410277 [Aspergillus brunneoviolaceus CBS 621.78]RAH47158.1 hypothetical protein BO95DRAFT_410277 [Aspergillus brunneoviolaceus CBS 621.78]
MVIQLYTLRSSIRPLQAQVHRYFSSAVTARNSSPTEPPLEEDFSSPAEAVDPQHPTSNPPLSDLPAHPTPKTPLSDLPATILNDYYETECPNDAQLAYADKFFAPSRHSPVKLWSASKFLTTPMSAHEPEVCFLGRSNVGKSSLLNRIMTGKLCYTSTKPGRTREMNAFGIGGTKGGESKIVLLDMPGYGYGGRYNWGKEIMKYLQKRKQLRRIFLLIDGFHGMKPMDRVMIRSLSEYGLPYQIVVPKIDKVLVKQRSQLRSGISESSLALCRDLHREFRESAADIAREWNGPPPLGETLTACAHLERTPGNYIGISALRWAILKAAGYDANLDAEGNVIKQEKAAVTQVQNEEGEEKKNTKTKAGKLPVTKVFSGPITFSSHVSPKRR